MTNNTELTDTDTNSEKPGDRGALVRSAIELERAGKRDEARQAYAKLAELSDPSLGLERIVSSGLLRTGDVAGAMQVDSTSRRRRAAALPDRIEDALDAAWNHLEGITLDDALVDWAYARQHDVEFDRTEYVRRAKWGIVADQIMLDWLECRPDDPSPRSLFINGAERRDRFSSLSGQGELIGGFHLGPIFSAMLFYKVFDIPARYLGAFSALPGSPINERLVTMNGQRKDDIRAAAERVVRDGLTLVATIDGNDRAPLIGSDDGDPPIRISSLLPRLAYRTNAPLFFGYAEWQGGQILQEREQLPPPEDGEDEESFVTRSVHLMRRHLFRRLDTAPENLRLHRGFWRDIAASLKQ